MVGAGGLTALNPRLPVSVPAVIAGAMGLVHGTLNGQAIAAAGMPFLAAWGIAAAVAMMVLLLAARVSTLHAGWPRIAARTLGSWAAAIGVLALAWHFRPAG
jgi:hydrogenase/urease accessory protein HupE